MNREKDDQNREEEGMIKVTINQSRPCTISESVLQSCKEVKLMREGKVPKLSLGSLFSDIQEWSEEES